MRETQALTVRALRQLLDDPTAPMGEVIAANCALIKTGRAFPKFESYHAALSSL